VYVCNVRLTRCEIIIRTQNTPDHDELVSNHDMNPNDESMMNL